MVSCEMQKEFEETKGGTCMSGFAGKMGDTGNTGNRGNTGNAGNLGKTRENILYSACLRRGPITQMQEIRGKAKPAP